MRPTKLLASKQTKQFRSTKLSGRKTGEDEEDEEEIGGGSSSSAEEICRDIDEQQMEDLFVDANEEFAVQGDVRASERDDQLSVRLEETAVVLRLALNNEFKRALDICAQKADHELYASLAHATLAFLRVALTMEQSDLQFALAAINKSFEVSAERRRRASAASVWMRLLYRPNYDHYTDAEIHAELVHAESLLLLALISFLSDQSIICLVRGAFRIRACHQRYKECLYIMESGRGWGSERARVHFESGVRMGLGVFNLLMSYLPRRVLRFLEYVGFSGNRSVGLAELDRSIELADGLRSVFSALAILTYHSYIENLFGLGTYDAHKVEQLSAASLGNYPNSAFFLLFRGRYHQMRGQLAEAVDSFQRCIEAQDDWRQFHSICHWEIMWCHAVQMDWPRAAHYSDLLRRQSKWSPASYTYQYATFLYAQLVEEERSGECPAGSPAHQRRLDEIGAIMRRVPELRIRYAGKTIPAEKFAITRAAKFLRQHQRLTLPALEFLYIWNVFATLTSSPTQVERLLGRISREIDHVEAKLELERASGSPGKLSNDSGASSCASSSSNDDTDTDEAPAPAQTELEAASAWQDDLALLLLLRGVCEKHLARLADAERSFMKVIQAGQAIQVDTFLVPHTAMELALLKLQTNQLEESKSWVKLTRNNYTGYLLETMVHFRLHAASRLIRLERHGRLANSSTDSNDEPSEGPKE